MKKIISILTIIAIPLGIVLGFCLPNVTEELAFIGTIYLNLLKFLVVPLIFCSISYTIYKATLKKEKTVFKSVILFIIMFTITFLITSAIVYLVDPVIDINLNEFQWDGVVSNLSVSEVITKYISK